jgi:uncharacterized membrane protein YeaQ/YmgE (transglycosylase-associated protein family)
MKIPRIGLITQWLAAIIGAWIVALGVSIFRNDPLNLLKFLVAGIGLPMLVWFINRAIRRLLSGPRSVSNPAPSTRLCSEEQIHDLEAQYRVRLPEVYKQFLRGECEGVYGLLIGSDIDHRYLSKLKGSARELLERSGSEFKLDDADFVFFMHQGYQFLYFSCAAGDVDPPVFEYRQGEKAPRRRFGSFSAWIAAVKEGEF